MVFKETYFLPPDDQIQIMIEQEEAKKLRVNEVMQLKAYGQDDDLFDNRDFEAEQQNDL
jgi:hypothetical protein